MSQSKILTKKVIAWALYDWANSAFALSVLAVLFPVFLGNYWSAGDPAASVTARLAWITAGSSAVICVLSPVFGTIADAGGYRKRFLFALALLGAATTAALALVDEGAWPWALTLYSFASIGYYCSTVFYDSLIIDVTEPRNYSFVSSLGFSIGYLGGAVLLALHVYMLRAPETFGLSSSTDVVKAAFISVGAWWALFTLPLLYFVPESQRNKAVHGDVVRAAYRELKSTIQKIGQYRNVVIFLLSYWLYIGGVFTVISMAVNYGQRLGFSTQDLIMALLITNFVGFPATVLYGLFGHRYGSKRGIYLAIVVYLATSTWGIFMTQVWQFYVMAIVIGTVQGGVQGLSRSLYASLIPAEQPGEFFGFYNVLTKFAHVTGLSLVGVAATVSDNEKWVLVALMPLFLGGAMLLGIVREKAHAAPAAT